MFNRRVQMNLGKNVMMIVSLVVTVILALAVLVPVIQDSSASEDKFTNDGYARYTSIESSNDAEIEIFWDHTKPTKLTINDVEMDYNIPESLWISMVFGTDFSLRYINNGGGSYGLQYVGPTNTDYITASTSDGTDMTITLNAGTITLVNTAAEPVTKTLAYTTVYYPDSDGQWIMKNKDKSAYLLGDSSIVIANGITGSFGVYFTGTVEDGVDISIYRATATTDNVVMTYTTNNAYKELIQLDKVAFDVTIGGDTTTATYSYFLIPYEITAERSAHVSTVEASLLNVIPLLVVIGIFLGAVWFIRQKN